MNDETVKKALQRVINEALGKEDGPFGFYRISEWTEAERILERCGIIQRSNTEYAKLSKEALNTISDHLFSLINRP